MKGFATRAVFQAFQIPEPSARILLSDADMMPTNADYFHKPAPEDGILSVFRTDSYNEWGQVPMSYVGASQTVWKHVFPESMDILTTWWAEQKNSYRTPWDRIGKGWFFDQDMLTQRVLRFPHVRWWTDAELGFKRMCRSDARTLQNIPEFIRGGGTDYHMVREGPHMYELAEAVLACIEPHVSK